MAVDSTSQKNDKAGPMFYIGIEDILEGSLLEQIGGKPKVKDLIEKQLERF